MNKTIEICRAAEQADMHMKEITENTKDIEIAAVQQGRSHGRPASVKYREQNSPGFSSWEERNSRTFDRKNLSRMSMSGQVFNNFNNVKCGKCGLNHFYKNKCPGKHCNKCKKFNHFSSVCKNVSVHTVNENNCEPNTTCDYDSDLENDFSLGLFQINIIHNDDDWYQELFISKFDKSIKFKLDIGAHIPKCNT